MYGAPVPLGSLHVTEAFDCGKDPLNVFLKKYASQNEHRGSSRTYVIADRSNRVVGYYTLTVASIEHVNAPAAVTKNLGQYPIPVILLARFATDKSIQGQGFGKALLKDALKRSLAVSKMVGVRAVLIHAKDDDSRQWYKRQGLFTESPTDPLHLFVLMKTIEKLSDIT